MTGAPNSEGPQTSREELHPSFPPKPLTEIQHFLFIKNVSHTTSNSTVRYKLVSYHLTGVTDTPQCHFQSLLLRKRVAVRPTGTSGAFLTFIYSFILRESTRARGHVQGQEEGCWRDHCLRKGPFSVARLLSFSSCSYCTATRGMGVSIHWRSPPSSFSGTPRR